MDTSATAGPDHEHGGGSFRIEWRRVLRLRALRRGKDFVDFLQPCLHPIVMAMDGEADGDYQRRDKNRDPASLAEFFHDGDAQDARRDYEPERGQNKAIAPTPVVVAMPPPVDAKAEERQRERQEHIDRVQ